MQNPPVQQAAAPEQTASEPETAFRPVPAPAPAPPATGLKGEATARTAGRVGAALIGLTLAAVGLHAAGTVRSVLKR